MREYKNKGIEVVMKGHSGTQEVTNMEEERAPCCGGGQGEPGITDEPEQGHVFKQLESLPCVYVRACLCVYSACVFVSLCFHMIQSMSFCMYEFVCFPTCVYLSGSMFLLLRAFIFFPERSLYGEGGGGVSSLLK